MPTEPSDADRQAAETMLRQITPRVPFNLWETYPDAQQTVTLVATLLAQQRTAETALRAATAEAVLLRRALATAAVPLEGLHMAVEWELASAVKTTIAHAVQVIREAIVSPSAAATLAGDIAALVQTATEVRDAASVGCGNEHYNPGLCLQCVNRLAAAHDALGDVLAAASLTPFREGKGSR